MANWVKVGTDLVVGGVVGAGDQLINNWDAKRDSEFMAANAGKHLPMLKKFATYFDFAVPLVAVGAVAMNLLPGDWATRAISNAGQLAGRQGVALATKANYRLLYSATPYTYRPVRQIQYTPDANPQPIQTTPTLPVVQPQATFGGRGDLG